MNRASENLAQLVAEWATGPITLPAATLDRARVVVCDTLSANVAGATSDVLPVLQRYAQGQSGDKVVLGTALRLPAELAALANGTMSAALEFDDVLSIMPGHPSAVVMPALMADDVALAAPGSRILEAYAVGIQAGARIAQAMTLDHYKRGFHATGTIAVFSAVVALARIHGLDAAQTRRALGVAASMASGIHGNFGTMTKPLHSGWAARNAIAAVALARAGLTASDRVFETEGGFFDAYGSEASSLSHIAAKLQSPWVFDEPGITLKLFPCCYASHRGIDAAQTIMKRLGISADDVAQVTGLAPPGGLIPLKFPRPTTHFESLFSLPYALAVTVLDGHPGLDSFSQARVDAPDVASMLEKVTVVESEACVADYPDYHKESYGSRAEVRVEITTRDGRKDSERVRIAPGHPQRAMTWPQAEAKFLGCTRVAGFAADRAQALFQRIFRFDQEARLGALVQDLSL
ncbi:MAG TPA: MmgE/PrpD family protein [Ramlibacter sp.]|nr:MmgE/PrpD family protein [Ramlibacter sp.]